MIQSSISFFLFLLYFSGILAVFDLRLARRAFDFAAASYAEDPWKCVKKYNSTVMFRTALPCDYFKDEVGEKETLTKTMNEDQCWAIVTLDETWITVAFRPHKFEESSDFSGTRSRLQLITELIETMGEPKRKLKAGGSVQHYFFVALSSIWPSIEHAIRKTLKLTTNRRVLFTGHSLGGALAAMASTTFAFRHPTVNVSMYTFGEPRVGNAEFATAHDELIEESWRVIHRYDLVAHIPYCYEHPWTHSCGQLRNHGPWHHGTEVWFPGNMTNMDTFRICNGEPLNEDDSCSNSMYFHYNIDDHRHYYGEEVSSYGDRGCPLS